MKSVTYSNARQNLASLMNEVCSNHDSCVITRKRDQSVVLMSLDDYEALEETAYYLRSPANARRLLESITEAEKGLVKEVELSSIDNL